MNDTILHEYRCCMEALTPSLRERMEQKQKPITAALLLLSPFIHSPLTINAGHSLTKCEGDTYFLKPNDTEMATWFAGCVLARFALKKGCAVRLGLMVDSLAVPPSSRTAFCTTFRLPEEYDAMLHACNVPGDIVDFAFEHNLRNMGIRRLKRAGLESSPVLACPMDGGGGFTTRCATHLAMLCDETRTGGSDVVINIFEASTLKCTRTSFYELLTVKAEKPPTLAHLLFDHEGIFQFTVKHAPTKSSPFVKERFSDIAHVSGQETIHHNARASEPWMKGNVLVIDAPEKMSLLSKEGVYDAVFISHTVVPCCDAIDHTLTTLKEKLHPHGVVVVEFLPLDVHDVIIRCMEEKCPVFSIKKTTGGHHLHLLTKEGKRTYTQYTIEGIEERFSRARVSIVEKKRTNATLTYVLAVSDVHL